MNNTAATSILAVMLWVYIIVAIAIAPNTPRHRQTRPTRKPK